MKKLWIRLGTSIQITDAEAQSIFGDDAAEAADTLRHIIAGRRFCPDGETCIPANAIW